MKIKIAFCLLLFQSYLPVHAQEQQKTIQNFTYLPWHKTNINEDSIFNLLNYANQIRNNNPDSALALSYSILSYSAEQKYIAGVGYAYTVLGNIRQSQGKYLESLNMFSKGRPYCEIAVVYGKGAQKKLMINWYANVSPLYFFLGNNKMSLDYALKAITLLEERPMEDQRTLTLLTGNIGAIYSRYGERDKATEYLSKGEQLARKYNYGDLMPSILLSKAGNYQDNNILDTAYEVYQEALTYSIKYGNSLVEQSVYANLGKLMISRSAYGAAINLLEKGRSRDTVNTKTLANAYLHYVLGEAYCHTKDYKKAEDALLFAIRLSDQLHTPSYLAEFYYMLTQVYIGKEDYKNAYKYRILSLEAFNLALNKQQLYSLNELEAKYKTIVKDKEIAQKNLFIVTQNMALKRKNIWILGISSTALLLTIIFLSFRINNKRKQKIKYLEAIMKGEENERSRIAKDLHDGVNQTIGSAKLNLLLLKNEISYLNGQQEEQFKKAIQLVDNSFVEVRQLSHNMMPRALGEASLDIALEQLITSLDQRFLHIDLYTENINNRLNTVAETFIYRLVQECTNNVIRHAQASRLDISVIKDKKNISITIEDNGVGFDLKNQKTSSGIGLKNIVARTELLNGKVEFDTAPGRGTLVAIVIPVQQVS